MGTSQSGSLRFMDIRTACSSLKGMVYLFIFRSCDLCLESTLQLPAVRHAQE